ncbi:alcohol dehydrogenase catalytic domain-containing protein [Stygiolobus caldivivus]|uniref:Alcohol dehydrogenase n=1 Tax=Stygiolobus caldivivus TaxID=2824673 RepID=A0A8D5ZHA0_9CREN|nr:alcohol dehydrogenase catalytic domain-containing protein [Stygiolobus caldivivus]BCU69509.1 alcohol dehydrogenase [Stygiolobus caldivivus]
MRAAVFLEKGKPLQLQDVPTPRIKAGEVLLKVKASGLCHGDVHLIFGEWENDIEVKTPIILGHEIVGEVIEGGNKFKRGEQVLVYSSIGCGSCKYCKIGDRQFCESVKVIGVHTDGGFAEYVKVPSEEYLFRVNGDYISAAPLADAGITAYNATKGVSQGDKVLVVGVGSVALIAIQLLKLKNAEVTVIGRNLTRLSKAENLGADEVLAMKKREPPFSPVAGKKFDYILDFVGADQTLVDTPWLLKREGELRIIGEYGGHLEIPEQLIVLRGLRIKGILYGNMNDMVELIKLFEEGKIKTLPVPYRLEEINEAIDDLLEERIVGRAVILP